MTSIDISPAHPTIDHVLAAYAYDLPESLIAQNPLLPRDSARLLVVSSPVHHAHHTFRDLPTLLQSGDLLVLNNTRVLPARLYGRKKSGTHVELLLLEEKDPSCWLCLVRPGRKLKPGALVELGDPPLMKAQILGNDPPTGGRLVGFEPLQGTFLDCLRQLGQMPLPPYIKATQANPDQYQTVYAERSGSAAAPTAGLHFTEELLARLTEQGIQQTFVTLHVGVGTFRPVEVENITSHVMHQEWVEVLPEAVTAIQQTWAKGGRVIAVGTTVVRSLESAAQSGQLKPFSGKTNLFIYPGYEWKVVQGMITNFHLPCSSLMMLVSALIGRKRLLDLYQVAIDQQYRFYSFGDAMLILPEAGRSSRPLAHP